MSGEELIRKVSNDLEIDGDPRLAVLLLHRGYDPEGQVDVIRNAIPHELELAIGGNERDGPIRVELSEAHTAMEGAVVDLHPGFALGIGSLTAPLALLLDDEFVVESELAFRHACEFGVHLDHARDLVAEDVAGGREEQVHALEDVDVHLVLAVFDALPSPVDGTRDLGGELTRLGFVRGSDIAQIDVKTEHVHSAVLGIAKVHRFVHQFVDQCHVVPHAALVELVAQVGLQDLDLLEQVFEHECWVHVAAG
eukprot:CAMPEP_0195522536 /NCGR_PEP_ID=MMETSP0794_2-20130614/20799_1 /TAXON_ID=515487 /ORGANISM="Stephanopyxis turris, Strain CCMP 815" /LENGTH=251 /DNA_ID=CAMNT_0040652311 /DNA_START=603 /DNA_END=1358 /DNA_ORIENTATION=-